MYAVSVNALGMPPIAWSRKLEDGATTGGLGGKDYCIQLILLKLASLDESCVNIPDP